MEKRILVTATFADGAQHKFVVKAGMGLPQGIIAQCKSIDDIAPYELTPLTHALCYFASDNYDGQASEGYWLWNIAARKASRQGCLRPLDVAMNADAQEIYDRLCSNQKYVARLARRAKRRYVKGGN